MKIEDKELFKTVLCWVLGLCLFFILVAVDLKHMKAMKIAKDTINSETIPLKFRILQLDEQVEILRMQMGQLKPDGK